MIGKLYADQIDGIQEEPIEGVTGHKFSADLDGSEYIGGSMEEVSKKLMPTLKKGNVVIGLGAGTITNLGKHLKNQAEKYFASRS